MEIFAIFVLLPAGGVVVCSITVNSVPEQKPEGISSYWAPLSTAEVSSVSWLGVWFLRTAFRYFSGLDPGWTDEMMCSGSLPLSQDQPHTHTHTHISYTAFFFCCHISWMKNIFGWLKWKALFFPVYCRWPEKLESMMTPTFPPRTAFLPVSGRNIGPDQWMFSYIFGVYFWYRTSLMLSSFFSCSILLSYKVLLGQDTCIF